MSDKKPNKDKETRDVGDLAIEAFEFAHAKLIRERQAAGEKVIIWRDGKICHVPASEIELSDELIKKAS